MSDKTPNQAKIHEVATDLNAGHRDEAIKGINLLTANLIGGSDYSKYMHQNFDKIMQGEEAANKQAIQLFGGMAREETQLWTAIDKAAKAQSPNGLCHLTIVNDAEAGPHAEVHGAKCH